MTSNHIDQLAQWWENAEEGEPHPGDEVIVRYVREADGGVALSVTTWPGSPVSDAETRILSRAPKPTPAWHNAVAVIAHKDGDYGLTPREVFVPSPTSRTGKWESATYYAAPDDLIDPVPLIEARVTDEMVDRAYDEMNLHPFDQGYKPDVRYMLNAVLGLDPA